MKYKDKRKLFHIIFPICVIILGLGLGLGLGFGLKLPIQTIYLSSSINRIKTNQIEENDNIIDIDTCIALTLEDVYKSLIFTEDIINDTIQIFNINRNCRVDIRYFDDEVLVPSNCDNSIGIYYDINNKAIAIKMYMNKNFLNDENLLKISKIIKNKYNNEKYVVLFEYVFFQTITELYIHILDYTRFDTLPTKQQNTDKDGIIIAGTKNQLNYIKNMCN